MVAEGENETLAMSGRENPDQARILSGEPSQNLRLERPCRYPIRCSSKGEIGVLKGLKRGGFQGSAFLRRDLRVLFGNRNGAPPHCDWEDLPEGPSSGRVIFDSSLLYREGASHLRARCARGSAYRRCSLQFAPRPSSASQPPCWLDANSCKPVAAMSEPRPHFQSAILVYVILLLSLCCRAKFLRLRRARSTAADISTLR